MPELKERLETALAGRYTVEREVGRGGMATVYLAQDRKHRRQVAVKILHPHIAAHLGTDRFLREIDIAARLSHPHILTLIDSGEADGLLFYIMPFVQGESLRDRMNRGGRLPLDEALQTTRHVAQALGYAHQHGVVHRDVKPENVMLYEGEAMVTDFGIAKALSAAGSDNITQTGSTVGTPAYMSPEQASGESDLDGRSDLYSLGCMVYEMLAGAPPFAGSNAQAVIMKRFSEKPASLRAACPGLPESVERAVMKALERRPEDRFATTMEFAQAIAVAGITTPPGPAPATVGVRVQGEEPGHPRGGREARRQHGARGERAEGGEPDPHHRPAGERGRRLPPLVRPVRPRAGGCVRRPGRDRRQHREGAPGRAERRREAGPRAGPPREHPGLRVLPPRPPVLPPGAGEVGPVRAADVPARHRDRSRRRASLGPAGRLPLVPRHVVG